jgi:tRNA uridine 5-carboxymethylaminomethyl modification enzyme
MLFNYDIIVVGGGHAGCEAASSAATMGSKVLLISMDMTKFGQMSCNPAIGGIAKGQIVREIDALGGFTGIVTDRTNIQFRMLNKSKGPAMWSPRAQCDRAKFSLEWRKILESIPTLYLWQDTVLNILIKDGRAYGVVTSLGIEFTAGAIVLTSGTFQNGLMHVGRTKLKGGRFSEPSSDGLSNGLEEYGFEVGRMKTGTPCRLDGKTIDFSKLIEQKPDEGDGHFSFLNLSDRSKTRMSCFITYTNPTVHSILERGFVDSPLYNGTIKGVGPRYCPSIEDKIVTFYDKTSHQLFLEPEGEFTNEFYLNGFSSSLPWNVQIEAIKHIPGLENANIFRPGYAIEYDYYPPTQLYHSLETKKVFNLFFAGQINGTTGYEEAAAQGLMAGINAHQKINNSEPFVLNRNEAYIGVLIDDLVTKGVDEPYRMFTSRAEYRILLRQDNADERLTQKGYTLGLAQKDRLNILKYKYTSIESLFGFVSTNSITPLAVNDYLEKIGTSVIKQKYKLVDIILRPQVSSFDLLKVDPKFNEFAQEFSGVFFNEIIEGLDIKVKYEGYIEREKHIAEKISRLEEIKISDSFDFSILKSISTEARQKLTRIKPKTIGQASRIPGVSPSDINVLLVYFGR